jgi:hypothetical protein
VLDNGVAGDFLPLELPFALPPPLLLPAYFPECGVVVRIGYVAALDPVGASCPYRWGGASAREGAGGCWW